MSTSSPTDFRNRNFFEPQSGLGLGFHDGLHHLLHDRKLGESGKREKIFARAEAASLCIKGHGIVLDLPKKPPQAFVFH